MNRVKRIAFCGTPDFSRVHLEALIGAGYDICAVFTQPDRPSGRGRHLTASPVKLLAESHHIPVFQPSSLKNDQEYHEKLKALAPDLTIVVAYGLILPVSFLSIARLGSWNVHASLLPRWRGAAPIQRAIMAGDTTTGVTIMQMDAGLDTGDMLLKATCEITATQTASELHDQLAVLGASTLLDAINQADNLSPEKQDNALSTYAKKLDKAEAKIHWQQTALEIHHHVRGLNAWPVASSVLNGEVLRIWVVESDVGQAASKTPGTILSISKEGIAVTTGQGIVILKMIQIAGKKAMSVADLLNGHQLNAVVGDIFES